MAARRLQAQEEGATCLAYHSGRRLGGQAPNQRSDSRAASWQEGPRTRLLDGLLGILAETVALNAASAGRGV